jgi:tRNA-binding EMAP/Myf-like protein
LVVDVGEKEPRVIFTGVRGFGFIPEDFAGGQFFFITNLAPRKMLDEFSQGMILAVDGADNKPQFLKADGMPVGAKIR